MDTSVGWDTERLHLEPITPAHAVELQSLLADPAMHTFTGETPLDLAGLTKRFARQSGLRSSDGSQIWGNWVLRERATGTAIGYVQTTLPAAGPVSGPAEVAWVVGVDWQRQGYAAEAARSLVDRLKAADWSVVAHVHPDHTGSQRVAAASGLAPTEQVSTGELRWHCPAPTAKTSNLRSLWRIRNYLRPYAGQMALMTAAAGLAVGASIVVPLVTRSVIDGPISHGDRGGLLPLGLFALLLGILEAGLVFIRRWVQSYCALGMETAIRDDLYAHLQRLPVVFHDSWQSGQLLSRATSDLSTIRRFISFGLVFLIVNIATFIVVVGLLIQLYAPLGILVAVSFIPLFLISRGLARAYLEMSRRVQDQQGDLATFVEESAVGIRMIRSFGRRDHVGETFRGTARALHDSQVNKARLIARFWSLLDLVPNVTLGLILLIGAPAVARGAMSLGDLVAFVSLMLMLVWPVDSLGWIMANGQEAMTAADRIYEVFDTVPTVVDRPNALDLRASALGRSQGRLRFEDVGFSYLGSISPVLRNVNLEIESGETLALVGVTGSGKTTLTALVPRLYDVSSGRITLDGHDIRDLQLTSLRRLVSTAFEEPTLFSASVRENVTLGFPDATDEDVAQALRIAQADFVHDLPWGLDTRIGEQGLSLSGGQRQRLALARAVIGRPPFLVLDDPLSALDVHTEALVEQALRQVLVGTTALLVVHRASTIALADRVAFLEDGTIRAIGTHSELMANEPSYRAVLSQNSEEVPSG